MGRHVKRSVQIYLFPYSEPERVLLDVWDESAKADRPQEVFRAILRAGLKTMVEQGTLPHNLIENCELERRLGVRTGSAVGAGIVLAHPHMMMPPQGAAPAPVQHAPQRTIEIERDERPAPQPLPHAPNSDDPTDAILDLMGGPKR